MPKSLAQQLAKFANPAPEDVDPEDFEKYGSSANSDSESDRDQASAAARAHYVQVDRSKLRDRAGDHELEIAPKFKGSRVSRKDIEANETSEEHESSDDQEIEESLDESASGSDSEAESTLDSEEDSDASEKPQKEEKQKINSNDDVSRILASEREAIVSRVSSESKADAEKGKAVQAQMRVYEDLLDMRIALQKVLNETNNNSEGDETGLAMLCGAIVSKRKEPSALPQSGSKRTLEQLDQETQELDDSLAKRRETVLSRWSRKVQLSSGALQTSKFKSLGQSAASQVASVLSDMDRLIGRTRVNRSQYKKTDDDLTLFDDTDFYRVILKDLVDRRMNDPSLAKGLQWKATKTKKNVDTKASKGRKLRYHVQEKVQGFDAPRQSVFKWTDEQAEELYSRLLGVEISMDDAEPKAREEEPETVVDENFALFG